MKKIKNSLILLAFAATAICGLGLAAKTSSNAVVPTFATYTNHDADTYYSDISDSLTGSSLLSALQSLNSSKRKTTVGYSGMGVDPSGQFKYTDYDPDSIQYDSNGQPYGTRLITFYSGNSATSGMNREHVWPKSHGGNSVEGDIHMPRPTLNAENGSRGNSFYVEGKCDGSSGWDPAMESFGVESYRGDSARIILYCCVAESKLSLLEADSHPTSNSNRDNLMGKLSDLIKWHLKYPVLEREKNRNEGGEYLQGNRNPFIDHRSYACKIWGNTNSTTKSLCDQYNGWTDGDEPTPTKTLLSIEVTGTPTKLVYEAGESFSTAGLTVTANYSDESSENVTSKVTVNPSVLTEGTTSVTLSYTYNGATKSKTISGLTVKAVAVNYGTLENPLSVSEAKALIGKQCTSSGIYTKQPIYCKGKVGSILSDDDSNYRHMVNVRDLNSVSSVVKLESLNMTKEQYNVFAENDTIIFHGYGYKSSEGTDQFKFKDKYEITLDINESKEIPIESVTITNTETQFYSGNTGWLHTVYSPENATYNTLTYTTDNPDVVNITSNGYLSFGEPGTATVTVTAESGASDSITFTVTGKVVPVEDVRASLAKDTYRVGETAVIQYEVLPENATNKGVTFESCYPDIASVDDNGKVTFLKAGKAKFYVNSVEEERIYDAVEVNVVEPEQIIPVEDVRASFEKDTYQVGETAVIQYEVLPENATNKAVTFETCYPNIATVDDSGTVTFLKAGKAKFYVNSVEEERIYAAVEINVIDKPQGEIVEIAVANYPTKAIYNLGEKFDSTGLVVIANYLDGSISDITSEVVISNPSTGSTGSKLVNISYQNKFTTSFAIYVINEQVNSLTIKNKPLKTHYYSDESFNPLGLKIEADIGGNIEDVTNLVSTSYDFTKSDEVVFGFRNKTVVLNVVIEQGTISEEHKAADFAYVVENSLGDVAAEDVTLAQWKILQHYYNQLEAAVKELLQKIITNYANGTVSAAEELSETLKECAIRYDEIYLAHKDQPGFTDFMSRSPKPYVAPTPGPTPDADKNNDLLLLIGIIAGSVVVLVIIVVICVAASKKGKKKHA